MRILPINNSDTAWLIVSDYNQDNDIGYPEELREDIISPDINLWSSEFHPIFNFPELCRNRNINIVYGGMVGIEAGGYLAGVGYSGTMQRGNTVGSGSEIGKLIGGI